MKNALAQLFDRYNRVARLFPALLALAPLLWTLALLKPDLLTESALQRISSALAFLGGYTLLVNFARTRGKTIEPALLESWGGWRTTALLRHRDPVIDAYTKARYHKRLEAECPGLALPTVAEETADPADADARYRSATKRLLELRRDPSYTLLHKENAQYGFRRNFLGLKPIVLALSAIALAIAVTVGVLGFTQPGHDAAAIFADATKRWRVYAAGGADLAFFLMLALTLRPAFVRQAADEYAIALFRTLE